MPNPRQVPLLAPDPPWLAALLGALAQHDYLAVRQLAALLGRPASDVEAVLERLVRDGQARLIEQASSGAVAHVLTRRGARLLGEISGDEPPSVRTSYRPYMLSHELSKNDLAVTLKLLESRGHLRLLRWETARDRLADAVHVMSSTGRPTRIPLVADALAVVDAGGGPTALLIEVDLSTVSIPRMRKKYGGYAAWYRCGGPERRFGTKSLRVLTLTKHEARLARLRHAAGLEAGSAEHGFLWFGTLDCLDPDRPEKLTAASFVTARSDCEPLPLFSPPRPSTGSARALAPGGSRGSSKGTAGTRP